MNNEEMTYKQMELIFQDKNNEQVSRNVQLQKPDHTQEVLSNENRISFQYANTFLVQLKHMIGNSRDYKKIEFVPKSGPQVTFKIVKNSRRNLQNQRRTNTQMLSLIRSFFELL